MCIRDSSYVTYCRPQCTPDTYLVQSVLKGRTSILQVYRTMELLLPAIYTFSLEVCSSDMQKLCFAQLYKDSRKDLRTRWKSASLSLYRLLDASGNLLFRDVLTHLELLSLIHISKSPFLVVSFINNGRPAHQNHRPHPRSRL